MIKKVAILMKWLLRMIKLCCRFDFESFVLLFVNVEEISKSVVCDMLFVVRSLDLHRCKFKKHLL